MQVLSPTPQTVAQSPAQNNPLPHNAAQIQSSIAPTQVDTVTLSANAMALAAKEKQAPASNTTAEPLPAEPKLPNEGEKAEAYVDYRKAKAQYKVYADIAGVATTNNSLSPASAYYLSNNDDARDAVLNNKAQQQQVAVMQTYVETSQSINVYS